MSPQSIAALLLAAAAAAAAVLYLLKPTERRFIAMDRAAVLAAVFSWLSFFTGTTWAVESWGSAWSGDPRQMAVGVMAVLYTAYIILKRSVEDPDRLGRLAASYLIIAVASVPVTLAAPILFPALHPATGTALPQLAPAIRMWYSTALILLLALLALLVAGGRIPKPFRAGRLSRRGGCRRLPPVGKRPAPIQGVQRHCVQRRHLRPNGQRHADNPP
jgi:heme exporter protein C